MFKQYRVFSKQYGSWQYAGSFSARPAADPRQPFLMGDELFQYVQAFAPSERCDMLAVCSAYAEEFPKARF